MIGPLREPPQTAKPSPLNVLTTSTTNFQKTVQALVAPQQMQSKQFIKVTIDTGDAAHDYYYIPKETADANLESDKQYTYIVIVTKSGLKVSTGTSVKWTDNPLGDGAAANKPTFRVTIPTVDGITVTRAGLTELTDGAYYIIPTTFIAALFFTANIAFVLIFAKEYAIMTATNG